MLAKLTALLKSKVALAAVAAVVVGGGGGAAAVAAHNGNLSTLGVNFSQDSQNGTPKADGTSDHAHTTSVEGLLTACATTATPPTISVTDSAGKSWTFVITSTTRFNGDEQGISHTSDNSATPEATDSAETQSTRTPGASATDHPDGSVLTLADVCSTANINSRHVQVQATRDGSNYNAWKVTLQGAPQNTNGTSGDSSSHSSASQSNEFEGVVTAVSGSGFTLKTESGSYTVTVSATTHFAGVTDLSGVHVGAHIAVQGALSGQTISATAIATSAAVTSGGSTSH